MFIQRLSVMLSAGNHYNRTILIYFDNNCQLLFDVNENKMLLFYILNNN